MLWHDVLWYNYGGAGYGAEIAQRDFQYNDGKKKLIIKQLKENKNKK